MKKKTISLTLLQIKSIDMKKIAKKVTKKYQKGGNTKASATKNVLKDRRDKKGIEEERAKGNTVYIPKPKPEAPKMKKGGTFKKKK